MIAKSTQTGFSLVPEKPACFPLKDARRGSHSAVSVGDKIGLFQYGYYRRLTNKEFAQEAGVSTSCINRWRKQIERDKCRTANKLDNRLLELFAPAPVPAPSAVAAPDPVTVLRPPEVDQETADFDEAFSKVYNETNICAPHVEDNVVATRPINAVRGTRGFVRKMTDEQELVLLLRQIDEKLTNAQLAAIAGVNEDTVNQMKRRHGCVGKRGPAPKYSEDEKRAWLKRGEDEGLSGEELAKLVGVADRKIIYAWRVELKKLDQMRAALAGAPVEVQARDLVQVMAPPMPADQRKVTMRRPDGVEIEVQVSTDEMMRLLGLRA